MTRASTLSLASQLTLSTITPDALSAFYDDALYTLATFPHILNIFLLPITLSDNGTFTLPDDALTVLHLWHNARTLDLATHTQLLSLSPYWQDETGPPICYTEEHLSVNTYRLYPTPTEPGTAFPFSPGGPFGPLFPPNHVTILATALTENLPPWLELPMAYALLYRAYAHASLHHDPELSAACFALMNLLLSMLTLPPLE